MDQLSRRLAAGPPEAEALEVLRAAAALKHRGLAADALALLLPSPGRGEAAIELLDGPTGKAVLAQLQGGPCAVTSGEGSVASDAGSAFSDAGSDSMFAFSPAAAPHALTRAASLTCSANSSLFADRRTSLDSTAGCSGGDLRARLAAALGGEGWS